MDRREAGKKVVEQFVTTVARSTKHDGVVDALLWWPEIPPAQGGAGGSNDATISLRMYKRNSWRSIEFAASDIDGSVEDPEVLRKYESEMIQSLAEF